MSKALISFTVEKQWLAAGNYSSVSLMRWLPLENGWVALPTRMTSEDEQYDHYEAESPGLSIFAIAGLTVAPPKATPAPTRTPAVTRTLPAKTPASTPEPTAVITPNVTMNITEALGNVTGAVSGGREKIEAFGRQVNPAGLAITAVLLSALLWLAISSALPVEKMGRHLAIGALVILLMLWLVAFRPALPIKALVAGLVLSSIAVAYIMMARTGGGGKVPTAARKFTVMTENEEEKGLVKHHHLPPEHER